MTKKARGRAKKGTKKNMTTVWVLLCIFLVLIAAVAGFVLSSDIIKSVKSSRSSGESETPATPLGQIPVCDSEIIYGISPDAETVDMIILVRLDTKKGSLRLDALDPAVTYSMSGSLYSELSSINVKLPQTGKFRGLVKYCSQENACEAGRKITSELLGEEILHYSCFDTQVLSEFVSFAGKDANREFKLLVTLESVKGTKYKTAGSTIGFIKELFSQTLYSDRSMDERLIYLEAVDNLDEDDVTVKTVPLKVHNETVEVDAGGWRKSNKN